jgi:hypothetical protein
MKTPVIARSAAKLFCAAIIVTPLMSCEPPPQEALESSSSAALLPETLDNPSSWFVKETAFGTLTYGFDPGAVRPASASGCNQDVCISIIGSSNHVDEWDTTGFNNGPMCTWPDFWINNMNVLSGNVICANGAGVFRAFWRANRFFPSPSLACNTWFAIPGRPCETIRR